MTLDIRGQANGRLWADRIGERIYVSAAVSATRAPTTPRGTNSLLA